LGASSKTYVQRKKNCPKSWPTSKEKWTTRGHGLTLMGGKIIWLCTWRGKVGKETHQKQRKFHWIDGMKFFSLVDKEKKNTINNYKSPTMLNNKTKGCFFFMCWTFWISMTLGAWKSNEMVFSLMESENI
jgi:hypothetical protein